MGGLQQRPERIDRDHVRRLLETILVSDLPRELVDPLLSFLMLKQVVLERDGHLSLSPTGDELGEIPVKARAALRQAVERYCLAQPRASLLLSVIAAEAVGGAGSISQSGSAGRGIRLPSASAMWRKAEDVESIVWERQLHIDSFLAMGRGSATRLVDFVICRKGGHVLAEPAREPGSLPPAPGMDVWTNACAFARNRPASTLYAALVPLPYSRPDIELLVLVASRYSRASRTTPALPKLVQALNELLAIEPLEEQLSNVPYQPRAARSLLESTGRLHLRWRFRSERDYSLPEQDSGFRQRKQTGRAAARQATCGSRSRGCRHHHLQ